MIFGEKTDEELKQLAMDIYDNKVFTNRHIEPGHMAKMMGSIFMPFGLGGLSNTPKEDMERIGLIYEYMDKAGPIAVNGYPTFMSMQFLTREQDTKMNEYYAKYESMKEEFAKST